MFDMDRDDSKTRSMLSGCVRLEGKASRDNNGHITDNTLLHIAIGCIHNGADESLTLDALLEKLSGKVDSKWQEFGLAMGHPKEMLGQLSDYSNEDCLVEILDYWLKHHPDQPTWKEVADALEEMQDYELADSILRVYDKKGDQWISL